ncbi:hypothetical protein QR685DRAFT_51506 [Neurospora intermedia]|uniref:Secreted peptide n=1 Tax=Neurospora intermedia TaxID=5142 RepID=A0ABR3DS96_NEUIN
MRSAVLLLLLLLLLPLLLLLLLCRRRVCLIVFVCLEELANTLHHTSHLTRYLSHHGTYHRPTFPTRSHLRFTSLCITRLSGSLAVYQQPAPTKQQN